MTTGGMAKAFDGVRLSDRRELRSMLAEQRHVEERELRADPSLIEILSSLPVFEVHGSDGELESPEALEETADADGSSCVSLRVEVHRLAPPDVSASLLDERFIRCMVSGEEGLVCMAEVPQLVRSHFIASTSFLGTNERNAP